MKDILFVPLIFFLIAGSGFVYEVFFNKPNINDYGHYTAEDPVGVGQNPKPLDLKNLTMDQKFQLIPGYIEGLVDERENYRFLFYTGLCTMVGSQVGTWEQMKDYPKGPKIIQAQYQKWWDDVLRQRAVKAQKK